MSDQPRRLCEPGGYWLAYYTDYSGFAVFATEIEALRHAVDRGMQVEFKNWGEGR